MEMWIMDSTITNQLLSKNGFAQYLKLYGLCKQDCLPCVSSMAHTYITPRKYMDKEGDPKLDLSGMPVDMLVVPYQPE